MAGQQVLGLRCARIDTLPVRPGRRVLRSIGRWVVLAQPAQTHVHAQSQHKHREALVCSPMSVNHRKAHVCSPMIVLRSSTTVSHAPCGSTALGKFLAAQSDAVGAPLRALWAGTGE